VTVTDEDLERIEALARAATPGPWGWDGQANTYTGVSLVSRTSMVPTVMAFRRRGMGAAEPVFWDRVPGEHPAWSGKMVRARDIVVRERPYRDDVTALDNADARFIAEIGPDTVLALVARIRELEMDVAY